MDFLALILFLVLYYIRPQEWVEVLYNRPLVEYIMIMALSGMLLRHRGLRFHDIFKTPHDWLMLVYFLWVVFSAPSFQPAFGDMRNLCLFYLVIVQTLQDRAMLKRFLVIWAWMIFAVAALAVASEFGFDPMQSYDRTHSLAMRGRLVLNTSIFNNPNALAHGVIAVLPMLYFLYVWQRPIFIKEIASVLAIIPVWCIYLTQSRGGYAAGFGSLASAFLFGRQHFFQILIMAALLLGGPVVIRNIRHMERPDDRGTEGSVEGRKMAFRYGLSVMKAKRFKGVGYRQFTQNSPWIIEFRKGKKIKARRIAPHSAINGIGAEQGKLGLFLWLGVFYCSLKTLLRAKCSDPEDERLRRILLSANLAFLFSSLFIDFAYRATFFITAGTTAAFHRVVRLTAAPTGADAAAPPFWNKLGVIDFAGMLAATFGAVKLLEYMAVHM